MTRAYLEFSSKGGVCTMSGRPLTPSSTACCCMSIPSPEEGFGECDINHKPLAMIFTFGKDSGLWRLWQWRIRRLFAFPVDPPSQGEDKIGRI